MPLFVVLIFIKRNLKLQVGVIISYVVISFTNDRLLIYFTDTGQQTAIFYALSVFTIIEYILFSLFLYLILKRPLLKRVIILCLPVFLTLSIISFYINKEKGFDSLSTTVEAIFIIAFCIFFLFQELKSPETVFIYQNSSFWFVFGMLAYLAGNFFLFLQASDISKEMRDGFWSINYLCNILKNILFAIAFYLPKEYNKDSFLTFNEEFKNASKLDPL